MCGLCGVTLSPKQRSALDWSVITNVFTDLLLANEVRGRHATGVATVGLDGTHRLYKASVRATEFIEHPKYWAVAGGIGTQTSILMGHTRWPTVGDLSTINAQPIRAGFVVGTHNGTVSNHAQLAAHHGIERFGQVDSEVLFRLALKAWSRRGWAKRMVGIIAQVEGTAAAIMVSKNKPVEVLLVRRGRPLSMAWVPQSGGLFYSSDVRHLAEALRGFVWRRLSLQEGHLVRVNVKTMPKVQRYPLEVATYV